MRNPPTAVVGGFLLVQNSVEKWKTHVTKPQYFVKIEAITPNRLWEFPCLNRVLRHILLVIGSYR